MKLSHLNGVELDERMEGITSTMRGLHNGTPQERWSIEQQRAWDSLNDEHDAIKAELNSRGTGRRTDPDPIGGRFNSTPAGKGMIFIDDQGVERRALLPNEKFVPEADFSLSKLIGGCLTNRWDHAERERRAASGNVDTSGGFFLGGPVVAGLFFDLEPIRKPVLC